MAMQKKVVMGTMTGNLTRVPGFRVRQPIPNLGTTRMGILMHVKALLNLTNWEFADKSNLSATPSG
jgi:hypothetical protein